MRRLPSSALAIAGWALLAALAAAGLVLAAIAGLALSPRGGAAAAALVTRELDGLLAGRISLASARLLPDGVEVEGLRLHDPDGHLVLHVPRARIRVRPGRLAVREIALAVELEEPALLVDGEPDGGLSLLRAVALGRRTRGDAGAAPPAAAPSGRGWVVDLARVTARGGEARWRRADGGAVAEATALDLDGSVRVADGAVVVAARLRAALAVPADGPLAATAMVRVGDGRLDVPLLELALGATTLRGLGGGELATGAFRAAVTRLGLAAADARRLAPSAAPGADVAASGYAESDGALATAALEVPPGGDGTSAGTARAAVAVRLGARRPAAGFDVAMAGLDPSRLLAQAPAGRLGLTARGAAAGSGLSDLTGRLALDVAPSRLAGAEVGPIAVAARAADGAVEVDRLEARLSSARLSGHGRYGPRGPVSGELAVDAGDLARLGRDLAAVTGRAVPALGGRLSAHATVAGTGTAPVVTATAEAPLLLAGGVRAESVSVALEDAGPARGGRFRLSARAARAVVGGTEARGPQLSASLAGDEAALSVTALLPSLGTDPVALEGAARLTPDRRGAALRALEVRWPGVRYALVRPAVATFDPPAVDALVLADGPATVAVSGGSTRAGPLELRAQVVRLDLARLPRGLLPPDAAGELSLDVHATGPTRAPALAAHVTLTGAALRGVTGVQVLGDVRWDGRRRLAADLGVLRADGGALELSADLPLPLSAARSADPVALTVEASGWSLEGLRAAAGSSAPVSGTVSGRLVVAGTAGAPRLAAALAVEDGAVGDLSPLGAEAALEAAGGELRVTARTRLSGAPLLDADARLPLDAAGLVRQPGAALVALRRAALAGTAEVPGLELARVAGKLGLPATLAGTVSGTATLRGTPAAPRGHASLELAGGAWAGYRHVAARVELGVDADRTTVTARGALGSLEALRLDGALGLAVERLPDEAARREAPLTVDAVVPPLPLARSVDVNLPLAGTVSAHLSVRGTLARPALRLDVDGKGLALDGRPVGDLAAAVRHEGRASSAELSLRPVSGGTLLAKATLDAPLGLADVPALRKAQATLRVTSEKLDLGFLPVVAPGLFRHASGRLTVDLAAAGPVATLRPRGSLRLEGGRLDVLDLGDWSGVEVAASLGDRDVELSRLEARRGSGRLSGHLSIRELGTAEARLSGKVALEQLAVTREGEVLAVLELPVEVEGTATDRLLDATVTLGAGTIRLPRKSSGALQQVVDRPDIVDADAVAERARRRERFTISRGEGPAYEVRVRVVIPGKLFVRSERPATNLEVKGDSTWRLAGGELTATGKLEAVRGTFEPIAGRVFHVERGLVTFPGGPPSAAQLDVVARFDNPAAVVTVNVTGLATKPALQFSSVPALDDAAIAMLIATGRTELNVNTTGVAPLTAQEAGSAMVGAAVNAAFTGLVADKLPVDQLSVDTSRVRAGKYLTDKLFLGYAYRFDAKPEEGENVNEMTAEFRIGPRWKLELRYGDAPAGDASVIWSLDY
jgi:translocation and assembly module TamB